MKKLTTEEWIEKARQIHGDRYDYSKVEYLGDSKKVCIICSEHGEFWQNAGKHKRGQNCPKCSKVFKHNTESWIVEAIKKHHNRYDYSKVNYEHTHKKVIIICPEHGEFEQTPANHLFGQGCPKCKNLQLRSDRQWSKNHFIEEAMLVHDDKYDYSKVAYINQNTKVCITCKEHGDFFQIPSAHLRGEGCPKCGCSHGEQKVSNYLDINTYDYVKEYRIPAPIELNETGVCRIDFYIKSLNACIEYNGIQHYKAHPYFGGEEGFKHQQERDQYVRDYCKEHKIHLLEISYKDDVDECITEFIKNITGNS